MRSTLAAGTDGELVRRNVSWLMADKAVRLVVGLLINVWLVRYLGAGQLGLLGFTQSVVAILAILSQLGMETILVRELVRRPGESAALLGSAVALRLAGAVATLGLGLAAMALLRPGEPTAMVLAAIFGATTLFQALDVVELWFQSRSRFGPFVVARAAAFVLASLAKVAALLAGAPLEWIGAALAAEFVLGGCALVVAFRLQPDAVRAWRPDGRTALGLLAESWPLLLNSVAVLLSIRIDQAMLTLMQGDRENGLYAAAQRLSEVLFFIPLAVVGAAAPALLRSHQSSPGEYYRRLGRVFSALTWIAIALAVPISLLAQPLVVLLFGAEFAASGPVLALHVWSAPALFLGVAASNWFVAEGRQRALLARSAIGAVLNVALNLWLIPVWGARGAALATLLSQTVAHVLLNALFPSTQRLFRMQLRALLPAVPK